MPQATSTSLSPAELGALRTEVLARVRPFAGRSDYAVTDPDVVDPCITERIHALGLPAPGERDAFVTNAAVCVENALRTPEGLARVARRVAERYDHPVITREGDVVTIDAGVVAGKLHVYRGAIEVYDTPRIDVGQWATAEVVRFLQQGIARYPDARTYVAKVEIPHANTAPEWRYSYDREEDRIRVTARSKPDTVYVSETLGGNVAQTRSLLMTALRAEKLEKTPPWR